MKEREICGTKTNNEKFNQLINRCKHPRNVFSALMALAEPRIEQADDMLEKREIVIGELLSRFNIPERNKKVI